MAALETDDFLLVMDAVTEQMTALQQGVAAVPEAISAHVAVETKALLTVAALTLRMLVAKGAFDLDEAQDLIAYAHEFATGAKTEKDRFAAALDLIQNLLTAQ